MYNEIAGAKVQSHCKLLSMNVNCWSLRVKIACRTVRSSPPASFRAVARNTHHFGALEQGHVEIHVLLGLAEESEKGRDFQRCRNYD